MVDILIRGLSEADAAKLKSRAALEKRSVNDLGRESLEKTAREQSLSQEALWRDVDALRERMGPMPDDSTDFIREWRETR